MPGDRPDDVEILRMGCALLAPVLEPHGFALELRHVDWALISPTGYGRGEQELDAAFVRGKRRLDLFLWHRLGRVEYRLGATSCDHASFMRRLAPDGARVAYPPFSPDQLEGFRAVAADLEAYGAPFLGGPDDELRRLLRGR